MKKIGNCLGLHFSKWFGPKLLVSLLFFFIGLNLMAQGKRVEGTVVDSNNEPLYGVTVVVKGKPGVGVITDLDGKFMITVDDENTNLVFSFLGMVSQTINVKNLTQVKVTMKEDSKVFEEVVIVGYGQQKKESVVGSITQTSGKVLERAGGVTNLGTALTGNLPGVVTYASSGMPGADDPKIVIRSATSWNGSDPLVLVDGIERSMSSVDISSVENVSVLKDASATAVYGVKGANGVILITTKRGKEGKAVIQVRANATAKVVSKLPAKYDSYDALSIRNDVVMRELGVASGSWGNYTPLAVLEKYRNPLTTDDWDRYPNIDWQKETFKDYAMSYNTSVNISGGTPFVSYFSAIDMVQEGDMFKTIDNDRGYNPGFGYNRLNVRSNLDFNLTKTTKFSANLFGSNGVRKLPWGFADNDGSMWSSVYRTAPDAIRPIYSDGTWGYYQPRIQDQPNSLYWLAFSGLEKRTELKINIDFALSQKLDMVTKGLSAKATISFDNSFKENRRGINDQYAPAQRKYMAPGTDLVAYENTVNPTTQLDFTEELKWQKQGGQTDNGATYRRNYYSLQLNYDRSFGKHNVTGLGLFSREQSASGGGFPVYREDWVFRATYNFNTKYFFEANGCYNGSEKFGPGYRFQFFPSLSAGWMLTEENFMKNISFLNMLKIRGSWGRIGDDRIGNSRFLYADQWEAGGNTLIGNPATSSPYTIYRLTRLGNPNLSWETSEKRNIGFDYSFLDGLAAGAVDFFSEKRTDILLGGSGRAIPSYFGTTPSAINAGIVNSKGYEIELRLQKKFSNGTRIWANTNMTHATNEIEYANDALFTPAYQKRQGYAISQTTAYIDNGFIASWDDLYGSTERTTNNENKLVGDYNIIDFNGDGTIDTKDKAPYQYSNVPQNTYSSTLGLDWKSLTFSVQFYGVNNVTREVFFPTFHSTSNVVFDEGSYWSVENREGVPLPRRLSTQGEDARGTRYLYDGAYVRLKNAEIAYTFSNALVNKIGFKSCRLYVNGSNLWLWTKMPDDREANFTTSSTDGAYPMVRRFNLGIDITL
jgi:TonB-linked SusC/RagA family outer membrane protein